MCVFVVILTIFIFVVLIVYILFFFLLLSIMFGWVISGLDDLPSWELLTMVLLVGLHHDDGVTAPLIVGVEGYLVGGIVLDM